MAGTWSGNTFNGDGSDDVAVGTGLDELLFGNGGNDSLNGAGGRDTLDGGFGDDTLLGGNGSDLMLLGFGADLARGGSGDDRFEIVQSDGGLIRIDGGTGAGDLVAWGLTAYFALGMPLKITGDLQTGARLFVGGVLMARFEGIERLEVAGSFGDDSFLGGAGDDVIGVLFGSDTVRAGAGDDAVTLTVGTGSDLIDLGAGGFDTATVLTVSSGDHVFDGSGSAAGAASGFRVDGALNARIIGAERFTITTGNGNDRLTGGDSGDVLSAGAGANRLDGRAGEDTLALFVDGLRDTVDGGADLDTLAVEGAIDAIDMGGTSGTAVKIRLAGAVVVSGTGIERLFVAGSTAGDVLVGLSDADQLFGGDGNDLIQGKAGNDLIEGGLGADSLYGGGNADRFIFRTTAEGGDTVFDLQAGDSIAISAAGFGGTLPGGPPILVSGSAPVATTGASTFLFDTDDGRFIFDVNGTGAGGQTLIATLLSSGAAATLAAGQLLLI